MFFFRINFIMSLLFEIIYSVMWKNNFKLLAATNDSRIRQTFFKVLDKPRCSNYGMRKTDD